MLVVREQFATCSRMVGKLQGSGASENSGSESSAYCPQSPPPAPKKVMKDAHWRKRRWEEVSKKWQVQSVSSDSEPERKKSRRRRLKKIRECREKSAATAQFFRVLPGKKGAEYIQYSQSQPTYSSSSDPEEKKESDDWSAEEEDHVGKDENLDEEQEDNLKEKKEESDEDDEIDDEQEETDEEEGGEDADDGYGSDEYPAEWEVMENPSDTSDNSNGTG